LFGLTTSNGKSLCFLAHTPYTTELWAADVKNRVGPFLKKAFPKRKSYEILLDGDKIHTHTESGDQFDQTWLANLCKTTFFMF
jgi:hypothetical protein